MKTIQVCTFDSNRFGPESGVPRVEGLIVPWHNTFWQCQLEQFDVLFADFDNEPNAKAVHGKVEIAFGLFLAAPAADDNLRESEQAAYWKSIADATNAFQGTKLARVFGPHLPTWLHRSFIAATGVPAPPELDEQCPIDRFSPDNPFRVLADGHQVLDAGAIPDMPHLRALRDHARPLVPAGPVGRPRGSKKQKGSGRPRLDPDEAKLAARMKDDGADWQKIAEAVGITFKPYDSRDVSRAYSKVTRLVEHGHLNQGHT